MNGLALKRGSTTDTPPGLRCGFTIAPVASKPGTYKLEMSGFLSPGWSGRLAAALAQHRIGIVRGEAEKATASNWRSEFELKAAPFAKSPVSLDYVRLAATELPNGREAARIELLDFRMETGHDGGLYVEVKGVDRLGFLGDLLDYFSMRCLFPVKMTVDTLRGAAVDRFWLRGVGGSLPSESIAASVRENLEQLLVPAG